VSSGSEAFPDGTDAAAGVVVIADTSVFDRRGAAGSSAGGADTSVGSSSPAQLKASSSRVVTRSG